MVTLSLKEVKGTIPQNQNFKKIRSKSFNTTLKIVLK